MVLDTGLAGGWDENFHMTVGTPGEHRWSLSSGLSVWGMGGTTPLPPRELWDKLSHVAEFPWLSLISFEFFFFDTFRNSSMSQLCWVTAKIREFVLTWARPLRRHFLFRGQNGHAGGIRLKTHWGLLDDLGAQRQRPCDIPVTGTRGFRKDGEQA